MKASSVQQCCDECGGEMSKAHRWYHGKRYCATCYARLFKRRLCSGCGGSKRLPVFLPTTQCDSCIGVQPCIRCTRSGRPVGRLTERGPVCNSCSPYYRDSEPCDLCGTPSPRLTRVLRLDSTARCCPTCASRDHETCPSCRRHRLLVDTNDGVRCCRLCAEQPRRLCASCGKSIPAGRGRSCEECSWKRSFQRRLDKEVEQFGSPRTQEIFREFGHWLVAKIGAQKAALKLKNYVGFFLFIEQSGEGIPSYRDLLRNYEPEGLRRVRLAMGWLEIRYGVVADPVMREEFADRRRIEQSLTALPPGPAADLLRRYNDLLISRIGSGKLTLRSLRLALGVAREFLAFASPTGEVLPVQRDLDRFLLERSGQRASLEGFLGFLAQEQGERLRSELSERAIAQAKKHRLERKLAELIDGGDEGAWVSTALHYFHGVKVGKKHLTYTPAVEEGQAGFEVRVLENIYWIPSAVGPKPEQ